MFHKAVKMLYIRIIPVQWHVNIAMRFELLGCVGKSKFYCMDSLLGAFHVLEI